MSGLADKTCAAKQISLNADAFVKIVIKCLSLLVIVPVSIDISKVKPRKKLISQLIVDRTFFFGFT